MAIIEIIELENALLGLKSPQDTYKNNEKSKEGINEQSSKTGLTRPCERCESNMDSLSYRHCSSSIPGAIKTSERGEFNSSTEFTLLLKSTRTPSIKTLNAPRA